MLSFIDLMRGIAILMVIANHVALSVPGLSAPLELASKFGQMGVQLFFVASAYTLCLSWQRSDDNVSSPWRFYLRRIWRIAPLYYFGIALFAAIHWAESDAPGHSTGAVLANMAFVHGFIPHANNGVVPGGWSIGTEMAFYAVFPLLMGLYGRIPAGRRASTLARLGVAFLSANLLVQGLVFPAMGMPLSNNSFPYFNLINQMPVFLLGMAMHALLEGRPTIQSAHHGPRHWRAMALATAALAGGLALSAWLWRSQMALAFALIPTLSGVAFCGLLYILKAMDWQARWLVSVGQLSYGMYIVHIVFAWHGARWLLPLMPSSWSADARFVLIGVLSTLLAWLAARVLARLIEAPGIAMGRHMAHALLAPPRAAKAM